jgi:hypothetical protein
VKAAPEKNVDSGPDTASTIAALNMLKLFAKKPIRCSLLGLYKDLYYQDKLKALVDSEVE